MDPHAFVEVYDRWVASCLFLHACHLGNIRCTSDDVRAGLARARERGEEVKAFLEAHEEHRDIAAGFVETGSGYLRMGERLLKEKGHPGSV